MQRCTEVVTSRTRTQRKLRRRARRERGAVLVEGLILSSMMILFMVGGLFFHRLYVAKLAAMREARGLAWIQAIAGCSDQISVQAVWAEVGANPGEMSTDFESKPSYFGDVRRTTVSATRNVNAPAAFRGGTFATSASNVVACNEIPKSSDGDIGVVFKYIAANVLPSLF